MIKNSFLLLVGILITFNCKEHTLGIKAQKLMQYFFSVIFIDVEFITGTETLYIVPP